MSEILKIDASVAELRLALERVKADQKGRCFVAHPRLLDWIGIDEDGYLDGLRARVAAGYAPSPARLCQVPKADAMVRSAVVLCFEDQIVYSLLVGRILQNLLAAISKDKASADCSYPLASAANDKQWIKGSRVKVFETFQARSRTLLQDDCPYAVVTDITAFYENMDLGKLQQALKAISCDDIVVQGLRTVLEKWAEPRRRGIPQGYSASDVLAKLFLRPFDEDLERSGFVHLRYVDDIRVFCKDAQEARRAIAASTELLYELGLNLQTAKTEILSAAELLTRIGATSRAISEINENLKEELLGFAVGDYASPGEMFEALELLDANAPRVLVRAFEEYFIEGQRPFEAPLFHFLLARLGAAADPVAADYAINCLAESPEESEYILRYLTAVDLTAEQLAKLAKLLEAPGPLYQYQKYQLLRWWVRRQSSSDIVLRASRECAFDQNTPDWTRATAVAYLGEFGSNADLRELERRYPEFTGDLAKAEVAAALYRQEKGRRNSFYGRIQNECDMVRRAVVFARRAGDALEG